MDYTFGSVPLPKGLQVFNSSLYTDIVNRGQKGNQGFTGNGFQGFQGIDGTIGTDGNQGVQGVQGLQGLQGNQGIQGLQGFQGLQGIQGIQGLQGVQGLQGLASSISVNNFVSGIQGLQSSFYYSGAQTVRTDLLRANTIQTDTITNSGTTFKFNASQTANFDGQGIYMSMTTGSVPTVWLRSSTATNKVIAFGDNTGSIPSASIQNFTASSDLRFYTGGNNEMCRMGSASNTTFYYPLIGTSSTFTNNYGVGFQGTQGSFGYLGCQSLQGQQGYFNSSSYAKDNYGIGFQGLQGSFNYLGCQTFQGEQGYLSSSSYAKDNYGIGFQGQQGSFNYLGCQTLQVQNIQVGSRFVPNVSLNSVQFRYGVNTASALTALTVSYGYTFSSTPIVFVQLDDALNVGSIPATQTQNVSTTQFTVVFNSSTSSLATLRWLAIGLGT